jgi:hypothetical protein
MPVERSIALIENQTIKLPFATRFCHPPEAICAEMADSTISEIAWASLRGPTSKHTFLFRSMRIHGA